jgi:hypothetical protein
MDATSCFTTVQVLMTAGGVVSEIPPHNTMRLHNYVYLAQFHPMHLAQPSQHIISLQSQRYHSGPNIMKNGFMCLFRALWLLLRLRGWPNGSD